ncbi:MAG: type II toxin-antitoxin system VapC family toxin [Okeania sp. SIO2C2]|uniref:type II toxin-antitoxin system VapC family toxin n=1 Tax=Okeania sp. SIO2C2 TaxID=2607787 RepID=UPI0013B6B1F2|nr:type II toxin-antitoxin system VapC family toxin [Okeania sp. SIO2C2]NEP85935.1 type II toxin-antitoxin system VapC family toxin [Okeania sp. SIO2C2]
MSKTLYLETSVIGYLTARASQNLIVAANIAVTREWWETRRSNFEIYVSEVVLNEIAKDDPEMAQKRIEVITNLPFLFANETVTNLAEQFLQQTNLPLKASDDTLHIALATVYDLEYFSTWNCRHIANPDIQRKLSEISTNFGYQLPILCTPYQLAGKNYDVT